MRRWLKQLFPIVMLAVLVQILAPIGTIRAAGAALDPFSSIPICSAHVDSGENSSSQDNPSGNSSSSHAMCCPLCAVGQALAMPPVDPFASLAAPASYRALAWIAPDHAPSLEQALGHAQARGPPQFS